MTLMTLVTLDASEWILNFAFMNRALAFKLKKSSLSTWWMRSTRTHLCFAWELSGYFWYLRMPQSTVFDLAASRIWPVFDENGVAESVDSKLLWYFCGMSGKFWSPESVWDGFVCLLYTNLWYWTYLASVAGRIWRELDENGVAEGMDFKFLWYFCGMSGKFWSPESVWDGFVCLLYTNLWYWSYLASVAGRIWRELGENGVAEDMDLKFLWYFCGMSGKFWSPESVWDGFVCLLDTNLWNWTHLVSDSGLIWRVLDENGVAESRDVQLLSYFHDMYGKFQSSASVWDGFILLLYTNIWYWTHHVSVSGLIWRVWDGNGVAGHGFQTLLGHISMACLATSSNHLGAFGMALFYFMY